jgi:peptidoglycan hydrolase-like protein with peptidoglycan-binding domain
MNKAVLAAGAAVLGYFGWKKFGHPPSSSDYQSMNVMGPGGIPIKVTTPVPNTVTVHQATGTSPKPYTPGKAATVPTTVPGKGVVYAPAGTIDVSPDGDGVLQPAPIVVSPGGAASIAVGSVKDVQHGLNALGYCKPPLTEDGKLGPLSIACIKAFQSANKLVVDGNAGPATRAAISAALAHMAGGTSTTGAAAQTVNPSTGKITTPSGGTVDASKALAMTPTGVQHALNLAGASPPLTEDGKLGPKSIAALKTFQAAHGLTPDGVAGPKTKTALYLATTQ